MPACRLLTVLAVVLVGALGLGAHAEIATRLPHPVQIYFIDVEGGQSTLIVTPDRHALLIDAGFAADGAWGARPGDPAKARDANRILAAARDAGVRQIDHLLITHFHQDHDGGVPELSQLLAIREFIDHGTPSAQVEDTSPGAMAAFAAYAAVREKGRHLEPRPGQHLPIKAIEVRVVSSAGAVLPRPLPGGGGTNPACAAQAIPAAEPNENPRSTGVLVQYGRFRFLDVGDLTGQPLFDLACPQNKIGPVNVYLVAHHGGRDAADPATFAAFRPRVAVMNNGLSKGGARVTYEALHQVSALQDVWQLHRSSAAGEANYPPPYIANLDESTAYWLKLEAQRDGSFRIFNPRTGQWTDYASGSR